MRGLCCPEARVRLLGMSFTSSRGPGDAQIVSTAAKDKGRASPGGLVGKNLLGEAHWPKPPTLARRRSNHWHELFYDRRSW